MYMKKSFLLLTSTFLLTQNLKAQFIDNAGNDTLGVNINNQTDQINRAYEQRKLPFGITMPKNIESAIVEPVEIKPNEYTKRFLSLFHVEIRSSSEITTGERKVLDLTQSYFGLTIGDKIDHVIKNFPSYNADRKFFIGLNLKASIAPLVLKNSAQEEVHSNILDKVRDGAMAAAALKVTEAFENTVKKNVENGVLTQAEYQAMLHNNILKAQESVKSNPELIKKLAKNHLNEADKRLDKIVDETLLQQLSVKFAYSPLADHSIIIFGTVGKDRVNGNLIDGENSFLASHFGGWASIANSTQGTGVVHVGITTAIGFTEKSEPIKVTFEAWGFHDRAPFSSSQAFVYNTLHLSQEDYKNQTNFTALDSNLQKLTVEFPSDKGKDQSNIIYLSTGDFSGDRAFSGGAIFRITPRVSFIVEGSTGRNRVVKSTVAETITVKLTERLMFFVSNENTTGLNSSYHLKDPNESGHYGRLSVGASYNLLSGKLTDRLTYSFTINGGLSYYYYKNNLFNNDDIRPFISTNGQVNF